MTVDHELLQEVVQKDLGFGSVDEFVQQQALDLLASKLHESQQAVARFEAKYGMGLAAFQQRVVDQHDEILQAFGIFEKEDDLFNWEVEAHSLDYYRQRIALLSA